MQRLITFLLAIGIVFISSCSVDKRLYRQGWHIQMLDQSCNKNVTKEAEIYRNCERGNLSLNIAETSVDLYAQTNSNTQNEITTRTDIIIKPQQQPTYAKEYVDYIHEKLKTAAEIDTTKVNNIANDKVRTHPSAITGFTSSLISLLCSALGLTSIFAIYNVMLMILSLIFFMGFLGIFGIVGLTSSIRSLKQIGKDPQKWKGKGLGKAGITLSTVSLGVFLLFLWIIFMFVLWLSG